MNKKIIDIKHHVCDGCCMWSGIEDIYAMRTGASLPDAFLFALSSYGDNVYIQNQNGHGAGRLSTADGRTRMTYENIKDILGLQYQITEGGEFSQALFDVKQEIDKDNPVIIGPIDMYYLPYLKMYHFAHIPMHYVLMNGYDEEEGCIYLYDCGRLEQQKLSFVELQKAWNVEKSIVGDKNGWIRFKLPEKPLGVYELSKACLQKKAGNQLHAPADFLGINAFDKIAQEFPNWKETLSNDQYRKALKSLVEGFGMVPKIPNRMMGIPSKPGMDIPFSGCYDRLGNATKELGQTYDEEGWKQAAESFAKVGQLIQSITDTIVDYYCDDEDRLNEIPDMFLQAKSLLTKGYQLLLC